MEENNCSKSNSFHIDDEGDMMGQYKKDATAVVFFKIVYEEEDVTPKSDQFKPVMAHQIFGDSESIFGYRSLSINLYYLHNSSRCYVDIQKSMEIKTTEINKPDDIMQSLKPWLPHEFATDKNGLKKMLENEKHDLIFGNVLAEFKDKKERELCGQKIDVNYKITKCDIEDECFQNFHNNFETFIFWYIDAANSIDLSDNRWMIYYVYEEFEHPVSKEIYRSPVGYCSVYNFFAYPDKMRSRISQFFILPPHQRRGIGSELYKAVINDVKKNPDVVDVTVEEPTTQFQKIRDFYDCVVIYNNLKNAGFHIDTINTKKLSEIMREHKICKRQSQRIRDILGSYQASLSSGSQYEKYLDGIKDRISADIEKGSHGSKRICNLEKAGVVIEPTDKSVTIEAEYKRYISDIEPSIKYLKEHMGE